MAVQRCCRSMSSVATAGSGLSHKPFTEIPCPGGSLPVFGHYFRIRNNFLQETDRMFEEVNGPIFRLKLPGSTFMVMANDASFAESLHRNEGQYPTRGIMEKNLQWLYNQRNEPTPMAFKSGLEWRKARSQLGKQLAPSNVYGYVPGFNRATDRLIRNITEEQDSEGYVRDMRELISLWGLEVGAYFAFGADLDAKKDHKSKARALGESVQALISKIDDLILALPIYKYIPTKLVKDTNKALDMSKKIGKMYAEQHMESIMKGVEKGEKHHGQSLLEQWLLEEKLSMEEAVQSAGSMMAAGMDTTVHTVGFMLHELSKHRDVQEKLYKQVHSVLGGRGEPDMESLQKMPYVTNVIKESQRLSTVAPTHTRVLSHDAAILGYVVPAGTTVVYSMYSAKFRDEHYKDAKKFDPDRWTRDEISPYASIPFGIGPRMCWGRRFAEIEMKVLLSKLSQHFIMESDEPLEARMPFVAKTLLRPAKDICIRFILRK